MPPKKYHFWAASFSCWNCDPGVSPVVSLSTPFLIFFLAKLLLTSKWEMMNILEPHFVEVFFVHIFPRPFHKLGHINNKLYLSKQCRGVSLFGWFPVVWLIWIHLFCCTKAINRNTKQSNRRSAVQWYFPIRRKWVILVYPMLYSV